MNTKYNVIEGTQFDITLVSSRAFTTNFNVLIKSSLITATGKCIHTYTYPIAVRFKLNFDIVYSC